MRLNELSSVCRFAPAFDVLQDVDQQLEGSPVALGRFVDELFEGGFALADALAPAILVDDDNFVERFVQQARQVFCSPGPAFRIPRLAALEPHRKRRPAVADSIIALAIMQHRPPPPRKRGHQSCGCSWHDKHFHRSAPASGG